MKKTLLFALLLAVGCAVSSQAVVIHWAVTTSLADATSAALVYVGTGGTAPTWNGTEFSGGTQKGATAETLPDGSVGAQASTDAAALQAGGYYVVLFKAGSYSVSTSWLAYNDTVDGVHADAMTVDSQFPAQHLFNPTFSGWTANVPEPSTAALLCLGAAAAALRRRKRV